MISYYPNSKHLNEIFDREVFYKEGDPEAETHAQAVYEVCAKMYQAGFRDGVEKMMWTDLSTLEDRRAE